MLGEKLEDLKLKDKKLQKPMRLGHVQASLPATLGLRGFAEGYNQGRQMPRAREAGLLASLFPSPAFGGRRTQSAIRKAAINSVQNECRRKMLAFFYDRVQPRTLYETCHFSGLVELSPLGRSVKYKVPYITTLAGAYNTVKGIAAARNGHGAVKSLQEYHASIEEI